MAKRPKTEDAKNDKKTRKELSTLLSNRRESVESDASDGVDSDGVGGDASDGVGGANASDSVESDADDPGDDSEACDDLESVEGDGCDDVESDGCEGAETTDIDPFKVHFEQLLADQQVEQLAQNHPLSYTQSDVSVTTVIVTPSDRPLPFTGRVTRSGGGSQPIARESQCYWSPWK